MLYNDLQLFILPLQIPANSAGLIEYRAHPFWLQKYCPSHELDGTPRCGSCERMEVSYINSRNILSSYRLQSTDGSIARASHFHLFVSFPII